MEASLNLDLKEAVTDSFLKTVSAFANYDGGTIVFDVTDEGKIIGLKNLADSKIAIVNQINDSIDPMPHYSLRTDTDTNTISLVVHKGEATPYLYKNKAYIRNDSSTVEVSHVELSHLILSGQNLHYEDLPSKENTLSFESFMAALQKNLNLNTVDENTLVTLNLKKDGNYTIAAELLADNNTFHGVDIAQFDSDATKFLYRTTYEHKCILDLINLTCDDFLRLYTYEEIEGAMHKRKELIPLRAFREVIANALIHRAWDIPAHTKVEFFPNRIVVTSPGSAPYRNIVTGATERGYSYPRNRTLANAAFRAGYVEALGYGIPNIFTLYKKSYSQPQFVSGDEYFRVTLPVLIASIHLEDDEDLVAQKLSSLEEMSAREIQNALPYGRTKVIEILNRLVDKGVVKRIGSGRVTRYILNHI